MKDRRRRQVGEQVCFLTKGLGRQECQRETGSVDPARLPTFHPVVWVVRVIGEGEPIDKVARTSESLILLPLWLGSG